MARAAAARRDPLVVLHDRARRRLVGRDEHRHPHPPRRRPLRHHGPQVVVDGRDESGCRDLHRDGQDRSRRRSPPPAVDDPGPARHPGRADRAAAHRLRLRRPRPRRARRDRLRRRAGARGEPHRRRRRRASRSRRRGSAPAASTTACARSAWASARCRSCGRAPTSGRRSVGRSPTRGSCASGRPKSRIQLESLRLLVLKTAWLMDTVGNRQAMTEIQAIKIAVPRAVQTIIDRAIQVHGARGRLVRHAARRAVRRHPVAADRRRARRSAPLEPRPRRAARPDPRSNHPTEGDRR